MPSYPSLPRVSRRAARIEMRTLTLVLHAALVTGSGGTDSAPKPKSWLLLDCGDDEREHVPMEVHIKSETRQTRGDGGGGGGGGGGGDAARLHDAYRLYLICGDGSDGRKRPPLFVLAPGMRSHSHLSHSVIIGSEV